MSKNSQNSIYYEIGVVNRKGELLEEYVTDLPIVSKGSVVYEKFANFVRKLHGGDILILWNKRDGSLPNDNRPRIDIELPRETELKYNR
jgi:hypothetical protein